MLLPTSIKYNIVLFSILGGILTGVLFDGYRLIRGVGAPRAIVIIEDVLFGGLCGLIVFTFLLYTNYAFLGLYVYIGIVLGFVVYMKTLSSYILKVERSSARKAGKGSRVIIKNFIYICKIIIYKIFEKSK